MSQPAMRRPDSFVLCQDIGGLADRIVKFLRRMQFGASDVGGPGTACPFAGVVGITAEKVPVTGYRPHS